VSYLANQEDRARQGYALLCAFF